MTNQDLEYRLIGLEQKVDRMSPGCFGALGIALFIIGTFSTIGSYWKAYQVTDAFTKPAEWKEKNVPVEVDK